MSSKRKILVAITARPSYSRIRSALEHLAADPSCDLSVMCSGSALLGRYGRVVDLIRADGFDVIDELYTFVEGDDLVNMALTTSQTIAHTSGVIRRAAPDMVVTIADRYETIGTAIAAAYLNTPLVHVQGGEITGNIDEKVRHAVTKLADYHLVSTPMAADRLIRMGEQPDAVNVTGCPSIDIARESLAMPIADVAGRLNKVATGAIFDPAQPYLVVLMHPETDHHEAAFTQMSTILEIAAAMQMQVVHFWPNVDAGSDGSSKAIRVFRETGPAAKFTFVKNLEGHQFLALLRGARCLIGNSSVGIREAGFIGVPVVNIGARQSGRERAENVVDVPWDRSRITDAVTAQASSGDYASSHLYGDGHAGKRIAEALATIRPGFVKTFHDA